MTDNDLTDKIIHTGRLVLRMPTENDAVAHFEIHGDPETNRHNPDGPFASIDASRRAIARYLSDWETGGIGFHAVRLAASAGTEPATEQAAESAVEPAGEVIGFTGLCRVSLEGTPVLNLYYRYRPSSWGRGYAYEAAAAELDALRRTDPEPPPVVALIRETNAASRRLAERLGLTWEPGRRDPKGRCVYRLPTGGRALVTD